MATRSAGSTNASISTRLRSQDAFSDSAGSRPMTRSSSRSTNTKAANMADTSTSRIQIRSGKWSEEEHKLFIKGIKKYGKGNWKKIANAVVLTRTAAQVSGYAANHWLDNINKSQPPKGYFRLFGYNHKKLGTGRWTKQEQILFEKGLKEHGRGNWKKIAAEFVQTRSAVQVASHAQKYFNRTSNIANPNRLHP